MSDKATTVDDWLMAENSSCHVGRAARLGWLVQKAPPAEIWMFHGGWLGKSLFEEARYCFVYGQFIAAAVLGYAFVERTLAAMFYAAGRNDLQRASGKALLKEAVLDGWIHSAEAETFERARKLRNPLVHFRRPLHESLPDFRAFKDETGPYEIVESDAKHILEAMFRLIAKTAAG